MNKIPETDAIFHAYGPCKCGRRTDTGVLRVSIDSKAKVKLGNLSRGGKDHRQKALKADDHDTDWQGKMVPFGILNLQTDELALYSHPS